MKLGLQLPINAVSFGQVSTLLLRTLYEREKGGDNSLDIYLYPIGQVDIESQSTDQEFGAWLNSKIIKCYENWDRNIPSFKLWHFNGSMETLSNKQTLFTFYELDRPTKVELNIAKLQNKVCFSSKFSCDIFKMHGLETKFLPLAFDSYNFTSSTKRFHQDNRIVFNLCGKFEKRKHHAKIINTWIKKYGNNPKYALQCAVWNGFLNDQQNNALIQMALGGPKPFNVSFHPSMKLNKEYNEFLNSADIIIGMSGGEGWGLPEFHSVAMGKYGVILNAHGYLSWANSDNSVLVNAFGKLDSADNLFFRKGEIYNQGFLFDWNNDDFIAGCEEAIKLVEKNRTNIEGLKLQQEFSKEKFADNVIKLTHDS